LQKLSPKLLANRLAPVLDSLISKNQTAFIKKRSIHDNFMYAQGVIKDLHKRKVPSLFIKLDISKAFDTVNWLFLLHIMEQLGFTQRWRNWISSMWCTASSSFMVNGVPGKKIFHCRGVRQGDPLSPTFFLLAMEPLHRLFKKAQEVGLLAKLSKECDRFRVSLYADDATLFIKPTEEDLNVTIEILSIFAAASGLCTNMAKSECYPIHCEDIDLSFLATANLDASQFSCQYLGLPLHYKKPSRAMLQHVIEKIRNRLPRWKKSFLSYPGREILVKSVLSAMPSYFLTVHKMHVWGFSKIDRFRRSFLWRGEDPDKVKGDHCLVNWQTCT
jgi:hypothetical protein